MPQIPLGNVVVAKSVRERQIMAQKRAYLKAGLDREKVLKENMCKKKKNLRSTRNNNGGKRKRR